LSHLLRLGDILLEYQSNRRKQAGIIIGNNLPPGCRSPSASVATKSLLTLCTSTPEGVSTAAGPVVGGAGVHRETGEAPEVACIGMLGCE